MKFLLIVVILLILGLGLGIYLAQPEPIESVPVAKKANPTPISLNADKLFQLVNDWRVKNGYQPYVEDKRLCKIAEDRADDGLDYHKGFYEKYSNYPYVLSENDFYFVTSEKQGFDGWLSSPTHLDNLKKNYSYSCIACRNQTCSQIFSSF